MFKLVIGLVHETKRHETLLSCTCLTLSSSPTTDNSLASPRESFTSFFLTDTQRPLEQHSHHQPAKMLEYFTYKKVKKHKADKEARETASAAATPTEQPVIVSKPTSTQPPQQINTTSTTNTSTSTNSHGQPLLDREDEAFLERLTTSERDGAATGAAPGTVDASDEPHTRPPLPNRPRTIDLMWESDASSVGSANGGGGGGGGAGKKVDTQTKGAAVVKDGKDGAKNNKLSFITGIPRSISVRVQNRNKDKSATNTTTDVAKASKGKGKGPQADHLSVPGGVGASEAEREQAEVAKVLDDLNLASSKDNKVFSLSKDSAEVVQRFTQVLKDLVNGVPTAYGDLVKLIEDRDKVISSNFDRLPNGLKKLVTQLPDQLSAKLAPEVLAIAAEAQGLAANQAGDSFKGAAKQFANPKNLYDLVTKPGAIVSLLKGIVNALKARWPAFIGTNVLWSVAVFRE